MSQDVESRISRLMDQLVLAETTVEIDLIRKKIEALQSLAPQS